MALRNRFPPLAVVEKQTHFKIFGESEFSWPILEAGGKTRRFTLNAKRIQNARKLCPLFGAVNKTEVLADRNFCIVSGWGMDEEYMPCTLPSDLFSFRHFAGSCSMFWHSCV